MENVFEIATEDGGKFCMCDNSGASPVFYGKEGKLHLDLLLKQAHSRQFAEEMRGKKTRKPQPKGRTDSRKTHVT